MSANTSKCIKFLLQYSDRKSNAILFVYMLAEFGLSTTMNVAREVVPEKPVVNSQHTNGVIALHGKSAL
mgnify:CR=1 FL=1